MGGSPRPNWLARPGLTCELGDHSMLVATSWHSSWSSCERWYTSIPSQTKSSAPLEPLGGGTATAGSVQLESWCSLVSRSFTNWPQAVHGSVRLPQYSTCSACFSAGKTSSQYSQRHGRRLHSSA